jgi:hypothetical protein
MSFFTSLIYYNPGSPPAIKTGDICRFIDRVLKLRITSSTGAFALKVKFGHSIDQDDLGTTWEEESAPGVAIVREIDWDIAASRLDSLQEIVSFLPSNDRHIYRAYVEFGAPSNEVTNPITRASSAENQVGFSPDTLSLSIGPINICTLSSESPVNVGWLAVEISGPGYLYPWTLREMVRRLEGSPKIRQLMNACRSTWPVKATNVDKDTIDARQACADVWPYEDFEKPWDWYWGVLESG